jgi:DNA-binding CsgD family transcriptional regulator
MQTRWSKQKLLGGLIILAILCSIGFSFSVNGRPVDWFWSGAPYFAILLIVVAFGGSKVWLNMEQRSQEDKIQSILLAIQKKQVDQNKSPRNNLSEREKEVLRKIMEGKSNKQIADELFIELSTVKTHINKIYKTLKVSNRKEASQIAES